MFATLAHTKNMRSEIKSITVPHVKILVINKRGPYNSSPQMRAEAFLHSFAQITITYSVLVSFAFIPFVFRIFGARRSFCMQAIWSETNVYRFLWTQFRFNFIAHEGVVGHFLCALVFLLALIYQKKASRWIPLDHSCPHREEVSMQLILLSLYDPHMRVPPVPLSRWLQHNAWESI